MEFPRECRRLWLMPAFVAGLTAFGPQSVELDRLNSASRIEAFQHWLELARRHRPGEVDAPVTALRSLPLARLDELRRVLDAFIEFVEEPGLASLRRNRDFSTPEQRMLSQMAGAERYMRTTNDLFKRLAMLHTDAMALAGMSAYVFMDRSSGADVTVVTDGIGIGGARMPPFWPIARQAIAALQPRPSADPWTRRWYEATTAYMFYSAQLGSLPAHLVARRLTLPPDATSFFDEGCLSEVFASDRIQATVATEKLRGILLDVPNARPAHERARWLFTQALAHDAAHAEARLRLARVHWRLGDAKAAATELTTLIAARPADTEVMYLAHLFLGAARWTLRDSAGAAQSYERALSLYPTAQSPAVALLLVRPGARDEQSPAEAILRRAPVDRMDPFFTYQMGPGRRASALLAALWRDLSR